MKTTHPPTLTLSPSDKHNRTLIANLPKGEVLEITIGYTGAGSGYNGATLDGQVIPQILAAVNSHAALRDALEYALGYAQSDIDNDRESAQAHILAEKCRAALAAKA